MSSPVEMIDSPPARAVPQVSLSVRLRPFFRAGILFFFCVFAATLPLSIKGAQRAWKIAFILWIVSLLVERRRPFPIPLALPLLIYLVCSGISTIMSPDPILSWDRMKIVCLVAAGIVFAENLFNLAQVRVLVILLLLSTWLAAFHTAWQYTYGVGLQIVKIPAGAPLVHAGLLPGDIIASVNGHGIQTLRDLEKQVGQSDDRILIVKCLRGSPFAKIVLTASGRDFLRSGFGSNKLIFTKGMPSRAQGTFYHYVVFAEILMQLACLAWAMLLCADKKRRGWTTFYAATLGVALLTLIATETRAAIAALILGCLVSLLMLPLKGSRGWLFGILFVVVVVGLLLSYHQRRTELMQGADTGMEFRRLMWRDGLRLIMQHPWFGVGMEATRNHWKEYGIRAYGLFGTVSNFHSTPLQIAVERGLISLFAWTWFAVGYLLFLVNLARAVRGRDRFATAVVLAALAGFVSFLVTSLVHYNLGEEQVATVLFFYFGLAVAISRCVHNTSSEDYKSMKPVA